MPRKVCPQCNSEFNAPHHVQKFCSRACWRESITKKVERTCQACGETFMAKRDKVRDGFGKYCSRDCADTGWDEPCAHCGEPVHRTPSHAERFDNAFCDRACYAEWKSEKVTRKCHRCGKKTKRKPSRLFNLTFCSRSCYDKHRRESYIEFSCEQCGQTFRIAPGSVNNHMYRGRYCSSKCMGEARRLPNAVRSKYNHEFTEILKEEIRERDGHTCQLCGAHSNETRRRLDVHHIDYDKTNNHPTNLISLCDSCHPKTNYNRKFWKDYFQNFMLSNI